MKYTSSLLLLLLLLLHAAPAQALNPKQFSSVSTVRRELDMEKEQKAKLKQLKKEFKEVKDVAIETWADGRTYYVLYSHYEGFKLMPIDSIRPLRPFFHHKLELVERNGHKYFKINDSSWTFYNGSAEFNPQTDFKEFGGKEYIYKFIEGVKDIPGWINLYTLDGTELIHSANSIEFRPNEPEGLTYDPSTGLSFYHPALSDRFFGVEKTPYLAKYGKPELYYLGYYENKNSNTSIKVPGGEYFIACQIPKPTEVKTEFRDDINGDLHEYKTFNAESKSQFTDNDMKLLLNSSLTKGRSLVPGAIKIKLSTPDQIVYYTQYDNANNIKRMGAVSLIDTTFTVPARFADVKVFYDSARKPYAMVKMSTLNQYEIYDPSKTYEYTQMSELELKFEIGQWDKVISMVKTDKIEDFLPENLYPLIYAEIELIKWHMEGQNNFLVRLQTYDLFEDEENLIMNQPDNRRLHFTYDYNEKYIEKVIKYNAPKLSPDLTDKLQTMLAYLNDLKEQEVRLESQITRAMSDYRINKRQMLARQEAERQRLIYEAAQARQANSALQQAMILNILGSVLNTFNGGSVTPVTPAYTTTPATTSVTPSVVGSRMIDQTYVSPEIVGAAIAGGWQPDTPSNQSTSGSTSSKTKASGNLCHSCFGTGKCALCNGSGRYMPNLDGKYIDCTSCNKSGTCKQCDGKGHH